MSHKPLVYIIVLNWNGLADTLACLHSLKGIEYPNFRIVLVDNGSTDGSPQIIQDKFPGVIFIQNGQNLGFAAGNNVGIRRALEDDSEYVLLLNNDTEVAPDFLSLMIETTESDDAIGVAGPIIYYYAEPGLVWSAGGTVDRRGQSLMLGLDEANTGQFGNDYQEVDFVTGCAILSKAVVLKQVGMLDERFFAYYEETEWCMRARRAGFLIVNVPTAKIWHKIPLDKRDSSPLVHYYMTRNRLLFLKATGAGKSAWFYTLLAEYLRTILSWSLHPKWRHKKLHRKMMFRAVEDAFWGRWGQYSPTKRTG